MPFATLDGLKTHYVKQGSGPCLVMMAPRGFESTLESWQHGKWNDMNAIAALSKHFTVIAYDRRESGQSGGRVEVLTWKVLAQHAKLLIEHLGVEKTFVLGVCMGVGVATQFASLYPEASLGIILAQPVGGHRWKKRMHAFFNRHIDFAQSWSQGGARPCERQELHARSGRRAVGVDDRQRRGIRQAIRPTGARRVSGHRDTESRWHVPQQLRVGPVGRRADGDRRRGVDLAR
jgi:pimeloyl-ACP methyl ester carboxylesterase